MTIEARDIQWQRDGQAVLAIEHATFEPEMQSDEKDLREQAEKGFGVVIYDDGKPLAYALAFSLEKADYPGCIEDLNRNLRNSAYIESLAVVPEASPLMLLRLGRNLVETLRQKGFQRATMHTEVNTAWCDFLIGLGCRELGRFHNWQNWGKTFAYLELPMESIK